MLPSFFLDNLIIKASTGCNKTEVGSDHFDKEKKAQFKYCQIDFCNKHYLSKFDLTDTTEKRDEESKNERDDLSDQSAGNSTNPPPGTTEKPSSVEPLSGGISIPHKRPTKVDSARNDGNMEANGHTTEPPTPNTEYDRYRSITEDDDFGIFVGKYCTPLMPQQWWIVL